MVTRGHFITIKIFHVGQQEQGAAHVYKTCYHAQVVTGAQWNMFHSAPGFVFHCAPAAVYSENHANKKW